jgi:predicted nucleic acid-binding protein
MATNEVFLDSAFVIALINTRDEHHAAAAAVESGLLDSARLVLTRAVCMEIGNALAGPRFRARTAAPASMEGDPRFVILPWEERVYSGPLSISSRTVQTRRGA